MAVNRMAERDRFREITEDINRMVEDIRDAEEDEASEDDEEHPGNLRMMAGFGGPVPFGHDDEGPSDEEEASEPEEDDDDDGDDDDNDDDNDGEPEDGEEDDQDGDEHLEEDPGPLTDEEGVSLVVIGLLASRACRWLCKAPSIVTGVRKFQLRLCFSPVAFCFGLSNFLMTNRLATTDALPSEGLFRLSERGPSPNAFRDALCG